jgi:hypothetical protein
VENVTGQHAGRQTPPSAFAHKAGHARERNFIVFSATESPSGLNSKPRKSNLVDEHFE